MMDSAPEPENAAYRQESHLYYLTGTEIPESALVLLFIGPPDCRGRKRRGGRAVTPSTSTFRSATTPGALERRECRGRRTATGDAPARRGAAGDDGDHRVRPDPRWGLAAERVPPRSVEWRSDLTAHLERFLADAEVLFHLAGPGSLRAPLTPDLAFLKQIGIGT